MDNCSNNIDLDWNEHIIKLSTGINMAYYEAGPMDAKTILLIHGVTDAHISWAQVVPHLTSAGYHCIAVDYRGNGQTDSPDMPDTGYTAEIIADDIIDLVDKLKLSSFYVVGHSFGTLIAQVLLKRIPRKLLGVILMDTAIDCRHNPILNAVIDGHGIFGDFKGINAYGDGPLPADFLAGWVEMDNDDRNFYLAALDNITTMPIQSWKNLMHGLTKFYNEDGLHNIETPILVIWGTEDEIFPEEDQLQVARALEGSNATFLNIEGASHNGHWDSMKNAALYAEKIHEFIKSI